MSKYYVNFKSRMASKTKINKNYVLCKGVKKDKYFELSPFDKNFCFGNDTLNRFKIITHDEFLTKLRYGIRG